MGIHAAKVIVRYRKALFRRQLEPLESLLVVGLDTLSLEVASPYDALSLSVALLCGFHVPTKGSYLIRLRP
ncbi:hypothetical protein D3C86_1946570 [compost metagenome]